MSSHLEDHLSRKLKNQSRLPQKTQKFSFNLFKILPQARTLPTRRGNRAHFVLEIDFQLPLGAQHRFGADGRIEVEVMHKLPPTKT